jgi:hypothetical protein
MVKAAMLQCPMNPSILLWLHPLQSSAFNKLLLVKSTPSMVQ